MVKVVHHEPPITKGYVILAVIYPILILISNIMVGKLWEIGGVFIPASVFAFPLIYIISDLMTEVYGIKRSMFAIRLNTFCCILYALFMAILLALPYPNIWEGQEAFFRVFSSSGRIVFASILAYFVGDWSNSVSLSWMKAKMSWTGFPVRGIVSSMLGQALDCLIFNLIVFAGVLPWGVLLIMVFQYWFAKILYEVICMPLIVVVVRWWKKWEGIDHVDQTDGKTLFSLYRPI